MNKTLLSILIFFAFVLHLDSQNQECSTVEDEEFMSYIRANKINLEETWGKKMVDIFVPVQFHSIATTQGTSRINDETIFDALCKLNSRYDNWNMKFYSIGINYINDTDLNDGPSRAALIEKKHPNALNIFVVSDTGLDGAAGFYSGGARDYIVIRKTALGGDSRTLDHELGHFFTLPHTHRGWDQIGDPEDGVAGYDPAIHGDTVTITSVMSTQSGTVEVELMDGSNCLESADEICDTPPDYGFGYACSCCTMIYNVWDRNGDKIEPMLENVMSYSRECSRESFTEEQVMNMVTSYESERRTYIRNEDVTSFNPVTEIAQPLLPLTTVDNYNGVLFDWEDVPNAEGYLIQIDGTNKLNTRATDSQLYVQGLEPDGFYFWSVVPYNKFGSSCLIPDVRTFSTGTGVTSISEIEGLSNFKMMPNPISVGQSLKVYFDSENSSDASMNIVALDGQRVLSNPIVISKGHNHINLKTAQLNSGFYILEINSPKGRLTKKLIIK